MGQVKRRRFLIAAGALAASPVATARRPIEFARIGYLSPAVLSLRTALWKPFFVELARLGWREGKNFSLAVMDYHGEYHRAITMAKELIAQHVDQLLAISTGAAVAAREATRTIPIVSWVGYPVEAGLAKSLARPGGNVTGVAVYANADVWGKFVELLRALRPSLREVGILWDYTPPAFPDGEVPLPVIQRAAERLGIGTRVWTNATEKDLRDALSAIRRQPVDAVIVSTGGGVHVRQAEHIANVFAELRLPAITDVAVAPILEKAGCVLAYSPNVHDVLVRLASMMDRILRGANPAEIPFELPARFDLVVNAKAANAIGLQIPGAVLLSADRVIE
jgi:putative ABC transport system substrate-binding protein